MENKEKAIEYIEAILERAKQHPAFDVQAFEQDTIFNVDNDGEKYDLQGDEADWTLTAIDARAALCLLKDKK